ncbi:2-hydroxyacid dehydrogenase [Aliibacillus thermotolerans]|uniref:2-hydroxyacid dehydrogenase n=1 Tax=Aliibacillus thermotolerans TaxID=1834418 RepID=A0ABW0U7Z3_9BACI|nr:D-glycerate dehydrogenase [Aliibacillus thermotolerans]MDA3130880.1 bifunctional glyoxylate/hydroxypyruvate reductase B [Aliibacillus thermotolerans]
MPFILSYVQPPEDVLRFMESHVEVKIARPRKQKELFYQYLKEADGLYGAGLPVNDELLDHAPRLKVISNVSVGYDNLDMAAIRKRGIIATHTPTVLIDTMADTMIGLMIVTARRMIELDRFVKEGQWKKPIFYEHYGTNVHHKTLGIIGMGRIGEEVARRATYGFHMDVLYHNRRRKLEKEKEIGATYASLDDLLKRSDFVMVLTPLTDETRGLIGAREFQLMKQDAIFLNGGRGPVVVEDDLVRALKEGWIRAAGLDVFEKEPVDPTHPLLQMKQVVTLPHIGTATHETRHAMYEDAAKQCVDGVLGKRPQHVIQE